MSAATSQSPRVPREILDFLDPDKSNIAAGLAALRQEVSALRALLEPRISVIVIGPDVLQYYSRLPGNCPKAAA